MPDNEIAVKITGDSSSLKAATDAAKEQLDKAGQSVEMLGDLIGVKVPGAIKQMLASSELIAPALEAAFVPLAVVALGVAILEATEKAKKHREELEKIRVEALHATDSIHDWGESLRISNLRLEDQIRTLQKKPTQNGPKIAMAEAGQEADKLTASIQKAIEANNKLLQSQAQGTLSRLLLGSGDKEKLANEIADRYSIDACEIRGNNMGSQNNVTNNIRVGAATNTIIAGNVLGLKTGSGVGIVLAAASSGTKIDGTNEFIGVGGGAVAMTNATGANPFNITFPTTTNTLPASVGNDTAGGLNLCNNGGFCWQLLNTGPLRGPVGMQLILQGAGSGSTNLITPPNAGGTLMMLDINSGPVGKAQVASDFTLAGNTSLQTIAGLSFTVLANTVNYSFHCSIDYSQATAAVSDAFGIQIATNAPTNVRASGIVYTSSAAATTGVLSTLSTTTATNIVTFTPSTIGTVFTAVLNGTIELPATPHTINFMASQSNSADLLTIKRGSYCQLF